MPPTAVARGLPAGRSRERSLWRLRILGSQLLRAAEEKSREVDLSEAELATAVDDVRALSVDKSGNSTSVWVSVGSEGLAGLTALFALALRRSCPATPVLTSPPPTPEAGVRRDCSEHVLGAAYAALRSELAWGLGSLVNEFQEAESTVALNGAAHLLVQALMESHVLRGYATLLVQTHGSLTVDGSGGGLETSRAGGPLATHESVAAAVAGPAAAAGASMQRSTHSPTAAKSMVAVMEAVAALLVEARQVILLTMIVSKLDVLSLRWLEMGEEILGSGLLEHWARAQLLVAALAFERATAEGDAQKGAAWRGDSVLENCAVTSSAAAATCSMARAVKQLFDFWGYDNSRALLAGSPSLAYMLTSHTVALAAALDGGTAYGMPAAPPPLLFSTAGSLLPPRGAAASTAAAGGSSECVGTDLAQMALKLWTEYMQSARGLVKTALKPLGRGERDGSGTAKALLPTEAAAAGIEEGGDGGKGGEGEQKPGPPSQQQPKPSSSLQAPQREPLHSRQQVSVSRPPVSLRQALRCGLQRLEARAAELRAAQGDAEGTGGSDGFADDAAGAAQRVLPSADSGSKAAAASRVLAQDSAPAAVTVGAAAAALDRCAEHAAQLEEVLAHPPVPPLHTGAVLDLSVRLAVCCVRQLREAAVSEASASAAGRVAVTAAEAGAASSDQGDGESSGAVLARPDGGLAALPSAPQPPASQGRGCQAPPLQPLRLGAEGAVSLGADALDCASTACVEMYELSYAAAPPGMMERLVRLWRLRLSWAEAALSLGREKLQDRVWLFEKPIRLPVRATQAGPVRPHEPTAGVVAALRAGYVPCVEWRLRSSQDPWGSAGRLLNGVDSLGWAQVLALSPPTEAAALLATLAKIARRKAASVLQVAVANRAEATGSRRDTDLVSSGKEASKPLFVACFESRGLLAGATDLLKAAASVVESAGSQSAEGTASASRGFAAVAAVGRLCPERGAQPFAVAREGSWGSGGNRRDSDRSGSGGSGCSSGGSGSGGSASSGSSASGGRSGSGGAGGDSSDHSVSCGSCCDGRIEAGGGHGGAGEPHATALQGSGGSAGSTHHQVAGWPGGSELGARDALVSATGAVTGRRAASLFSYVTVLLLPSTCGLLRSLVACNKPCPGMEEYSYTVEPKAAADVLSSVPLLAAAATADGKVPGPRCAAPVVAIGGSGMGCGSCGGGEGGYGGGRDAPEVGHGCGDDSEGAASGQRRWHWQQVASGEVDAADEWRSFLLRDLDLPWLLRAAIGMAVSGKVDKYRMCLLGRALLLALRALVRRMPAELAAALAAPAAGGPAPPKGVAAKAAPASALQRTAAPSPVASPADRAVSSSLTQLRRLLGPGGTLQEPVLLAAVEAVCAGSGGGNGAGSSGGGNGAGSSGGGVSSTATCAAGDGVSAAEREQRRWSALALLLPPPSEVRAVLRVCSNPQCTSLEGPSEAAAALRRCDGRCGGAAAYCGRACQVAHWRGGHSGECGKAEAAAAAVRAPE